MGFLCSICSEALSRNINPGDANDRSTVQKSNHANLMSTPCGHVYHTHCILTWFQKQPGVESTCPICRQRVKSMKCQPIFLDWTEASILDASQYESAIANSEAALEISREEIKALKVQIAATRVDLEDTRQTLQAVSNESSKIMASLTSEKAKSDALLMRCKEAESYQTYAEQKESQCLKLQQEIKTYEYIKLMLQELRLDIEHDAKSFPFSSDSVEPLLQIKAVLTKELASATQRLKSTESDSKLHQQLTRNYTRKISKLEAQVGEMQLIISGNNLVKIRLPESSKLTKESNLTGYHCSTPNPPNAEQEGMKGTKRGRKKTTKELETIDLISDEENLKKTKSGGVIKNGCSLDEVVSTKRLDGLFRTYSSAQSKPATTTSDYTALSPLDLPCKNSLPGMGGTDNLRIKTGLSGVTASSFRRCPWK